MYVTCFSRDLTPQRRRQLLLPDSGLLLLRRDNYIQETSRGYHRQHRVAAAPLYGTAAVTLGRAHHHRREPLAGREPLP